MAPLPVSSELSGAVGLCALLLAACVGSSTGAPDTAPGGAPATAESAAPANEVRVLAEQEQFSHSFSPDASGRVDLEGLPPGAHWDPAQNTLHFRPDFTQGGQTWTVRQRGGPSLVIEVRDTVRPPVPQVLDSDPQPGYTRHRIVQTTDAFLDSPSLAGRKLEAYVTVPTQPGPHPVRLQLHGFSPASQTLKFGSSSEMIVHPQDLANTYWWGYAERPLGGAAADTPVPNYTQRRALHLLEWALEHFGGDPQRVHVEGASMGGAGAATLGLLSARHFAWVRSGVGQMIPRNHRPTRIAQLARFWGKPEQALTSPGSEGRSVWDHMDLTRALHEDPEAGGQFLVLKHSKDDRIIHFGAVVQPSPLTNESFYTSLQSQRVGHVVAWDEGGHMSPDPALGPRWWHDAWDPSTDERTYLRRDLAFPAFSASSADGKPGTGKSTDGRDWHPRAGYAGQVAVLGDSGWDGDRFGTYNRYLRWDSSAIVDGFDTFSVPLGLSAEAQAAAPIRADVTLRRTQRFAPRPGEQLTFVLGQQRGNVHASGEGLVTIPGLWIGPKWELLKVDRSPR